MKLRLLLGPVLLSLVACGGAQQPSSTELGWGSIRDAIPADVDWFVYAHPSGTLDAVWGAEMANIGADASGRDALQNINDTLGFDLLDAEARKAAGLAEHGEWAVIDIESGPIGVMELGNATAFNKTLSDIERRNPDSGVQRVRIGGTEFRRIPLGTDGWIDLGVRERFAFARLHTGHSILDASDADVAALFRGPGSANFWASEAGQKLVATHGPRAEQPEFAAFVQTSALTELADYAIASFVAPTQTTPAATDDRLAPYTSTAQRDLCRGIVDRIPAAMPWIGSISVARNDGTHGTDSSSLVHFSDRGAEVARAILRPSLGAVRDGTEEAAFVGAGHLELRPFLELFDAPADAMECPDTARAIALISKLRSEYRRQIDFNLALANGDAALALFDIRLAGFIPFVDAALMLGSPEGASARLASQLQKEIERRGGRGTVDETSPFTKVDFRLLTLRLSLIRAEDRVIVTVGDVPTAYVNALASSEDAPGNPVVSTRWNGPKSLDIATRAIEHLVEINSFSAEQGQQFLQGLLSWAHFTDVSGSTSWSGNDLVGRGQSTLSATPTEVAKP